MAERNKARQRTALCFSCACAIFISFYSFIMAFIKNTCVFNDNENAFLTVIKTLYDLKR